MVVGACAGWPSVMRPPRPMISVVSTNSDCIGGNVSTAHLSGPYSTMAPPGLRPAAVTAVGVAWEPNANGAA